MRKLLSLISLVILVGLVFSSPISLAEETNITILHLNDLHGHLEPFKASGDSEETIGGIARIATLVKEIRAEQPNTILVDAGDTIHGTNIANLFYGESVIEAYNKLGVDAMDIGNHDFNYGFEALKGLAEKADFPFLSANLEYKDGRPIDFIDRYVIEEVGGIKIGIIGLVTPETVYLTHPKNVENLKFLDPAEIASSIAKEIGDEVDLLVVLAHLETAEVEKVADETPGLDVIVAGHTELEKSYKVGDVLIVQALDYGKLLGRLDLTIGDNGEITYKHNLIPIDESIAFDKDMEELVASYRDALDTKLSAVIGEAKVNLNGERGDVRTKETNLGDLIADIMRERANADLAIQNGGGIRASILEGPVKVEDVFTVLPFDNYLIALQMTGEGVLEALENGVSKVEETAGRFPQVSGLTFTLDPSKPAGERVSEVKIKGEPLELDKEYIVATNDFMAAGGDDYVSFKEAPMTLVTGELLRDVVTDYIKKMGEVAPEVEGRINIIE